MPSPYEGDPKIKRDFTYTDTLLMIKVLNFKKHETYEAELARNLKVTSSRISKIIKYFKKIGVIKIKSKIGSNIMIIINRSNLKHFIDEQNVLGWLADNFLNKYNRYSYKDY